jgi:hypothetical protein
LIRALMQTQNEKSVAELDPVAQFTEGVKMLKNAYPKNAVVCLSANSTT